MARRANNQYSFILGSFTLFLLGFFFGATGESSTTSYFQQVTPPDTTASDTTRVPYKPSKRPTYQPTDRFGDPFSGRTSSSPLYPSPSTEMEVEIDTGFNYTIYENLGDVRYRPVTTMSLEEYNDYMRRRTIRDYWKNQSAGLDGESPVSGRSLIPPIYTSPLFDRIFGGSFVNIRPNGFVTLDFGARFDRVENPAIPIRAQRRNQFQFDQQINMNVVGEIGEKLKVTANFDSNNSFDFENNFRVEYTGFEEEIIKKIELGNVSLPVRNSLMSGSQSLFGVKTQLQFGRLFITGVATTQRGETDAIEIENGAQSSTFSVRASEYDANRHFFLGHFFRDNYGIEQGQWLHRMPQITSGVNITRLEVYVVNRNNDTQTLRNIAAFIDLGESEAENARLPNNDLIKGTTGFKPGPNSNDANGLFNNLRTNADLRKLDNIDGILKNAKLEASTDYVIIKSARKLDPREYTFNSSLGYLSLNRQLQNDEALAVAYEYTYNGKPYQVGELSENYQEREASELIFMKMLRPNVINTNIPSWDLMMKNIYNLNAGQVSREGFQLRIMYRDDRSTVDNPNLQEGKNTNNIPLVQVMGLDQLNQANDPQPDGNFDFIEGITINLDRGNIIFPVTEPFGSHLREQFEEDERTLIDRYVYDTLYRTTQNAAEQVVAKNKFFLTGSYAAGSTREIALPGINIAEGSVRVMAGNIPLTEGVDYTVDYNFGRVNILNEGITNSGKKIKISYEKASLLNFQTRRFLGTQFDYILNEDFSIGGTLLYLNELPMVSRVSIGEEPTKNIKWGLDLNYRKDSRFLTRMVDKLPLIQTKEISTFSFNAEFAQMVPGTSNVVAGEGTSYVDDFEAAVTTYSLSNSGDTWGLAATPKTNDNLFFGDSNGLQFGHRRAKLAWYVVDNIFYNERDRSRYAPNLNKEIMKNHYMRAVSPQEIFPQRSTRTFNFNEPIFDLAYFPVERGPYNYYPELTSEGKLPTPQNNWGGITRAITSNVDFDQTNIEYLEFWMMDPFIAGEYGRNAAFEEYNIANEGSGGKLVFNLGSISEDYIKDKRHGFENGLPPTTENTAEVEAKEWGRVTTKQFLNNAFAVDPEARKNQDVGMDGLRNDQETAYFQDFIKKITVGARAKIEEDPSADNFAPFISEDLTTREANVITRYKNFNNQEGNTPINSGNSDYTARSKATPDNEDLNQDNSINELEQYYQYVVDLRPSQLEVGKGYVVDKVTHNDTEKGNGPATWYLFRIPIKDVTADNAYGGIQDFKSIRFMRTYLTGFTDPVLLRFAQMQLVGSQWRKTPLENLMESGLIEYKDLDQSNFTVTAVSVENSGGGPVTYQLPPGFVRDRDNTAYNQNVRLNEQSIQLCVDDLPNKEARAVFKNVSLDLVNYGRIKMLLHAHANGSSFLNDNEVTGFLRLGYDPNNYYEIEIPLKVTPAGSKSDAEIWPAENEIDIALDELYQLKALRNRQNKSIDMRFGGQAGRHNIYVKGNPEISNIVNMMIGIRNPNLVNDDKASKSVCMWANELRVTDFDSRAGWAGNARMNTRLADLADISASTRYTSVGFGNISDKVSQRTREEMLSYDVAANIALEKFLPESSRLQLPMFVSFERSIATPYYDPANPDLPLASVLNSFETEEEGREYKLITQDRATRRSINFTNLRLAPREGKKPLLISPENFSLTYAYSDVINTSWEIANYELRTYKAAVGYNFTPEVVPILPFANAEAFSSPYLQWLKDFNFSLMPSNISVRWDLDRRYLMRQLRNADLTPQEDAQFEKLFTMNRNYSLRWSLTNALMLDYNARASAIIDEPEGAIDSDIKRDSLTNNLYNLGRMKHFDQTFGLTYRLPLDKMPLTNWLSAEARYEAGYNWTAASFEQQKTFGNTIQNNRTYNLSGKMDLVKLYNKVGYLKKVNDEMLRKGRPAGPQRPGQRPGQKTPGKEETEEQGLGPAKGFISLLMAIKSVNFNYQRTQGTMLPGFGKKAFLFGLDSSFVAPGLPFLLGSQDPEIRRVAAREGWLVQSSELTTPFTQADGTNFDIRADVQPVSDLRIQLDLKKSKTANYQEIFRYVDDKEIFEPLTPSRNGSYSITYNMLATAFDKQLENNGSEAFEKFAEYRQDILNRLVDLPNNGGEFTLRSQDVLIPAFLAAYSGKDPNEVKLSPFPNIPLPNWRVEYTGLSKLPKFKDKFSAFTVSHTYISRYSVNNYNNSLVYQNAADLISLNRRVEDYTSADNTLTSQEQGSTNFVPLYVANQVVLTEQFAPLIGINVRTKNRFTANVSYNKERNLALNLSNTQLTEQNKRDIRIDVGYTTANFKLPFRSKGREIILKNDIAFKMGLTIMKNQIIQRKFDEPDDITNGNVSFQLNPTINYVVNQQLSLQMYYNSSVNDPLVLTSFRNTQSNFGIQLRYNITQ